MASNQPLLASQGTSDSVEDEDSTSSSSSGDEEEDEEEGVIEAPFRAGAQVAPAGDDMTRAGSVMAASGSVMPGPTKAKNRWMKAGAAVRAQVLVRKIFTSMATDERKRYVMSLFMTSVLLNVLDTESKAMAFHSESVGMYSEKSLQYPDGKPYKFSYSLFIALLVFIVKLGLGPIKTMMHKAGDHGHGAKHAHGTSSTSPDHSQRPRAKTGAGAKRPRAKTEAEAAHKKNLKEAKSAGWFETAKTLMSEHGTSVKQAVMPWVLLVAFTLCEMISMTMANYALNITPTSIFIVLRCSKMGIVAVITRLLLGTKLRNVQWVALILMAIALLVATVAESKGGSKGGGVSFQGPIILIISEVFYSMMLILQQIAVTEYWPEPMLLVSASAALGIPLTLTSMYAASNVRNPLPPHQPVSDVGDVFVMLSNSWVLTLAIVGHLVFRISLDVWHIVSAKHLPALERAMTDVVKLCIMWFLGKSFYLLGWLIYKNDWPAKGGVLAVLGEPWQPHSWMMIPGLVLISYAMLMYKFKVYTPVKLSKDKQGKWGLEFQQAVQTDEEKQFADTGLDDPFFSAAFTNRKIRNRLKDQLGAALENHRQKKQTVFRTGVAKNKWQAAALKTTLVQNPHPEAADPTVGFKAGS